MKKRKLTPFGMVVVGTVKLALIAVLVFTAVIGGLYVNAVQMDARYAAMSERYGG